jgi:serine/threonine protein kinase
MDGSDWPRRWKEIEPIFERALEIPPANAGRYLDEACGGDTELRRAVEALLESARAESGPLDRGAGEYASSLLVGLADDAVGPEIGPSDVPQRLGPYRIGAEIGSGGMARVYEAERDDGVYRQRVALKLMRRRPEDADERRRRFEVEREVLAALDHPGIARILDGGETEDGRPYLVMERVDGVRLDEWRTQQEPTLEAILDLLTEICAAVHFAHQRLIVHRDLKPSNILVTAEGRPKLLDFGIAKLLEPEAGTSDELARTRTGLLLLTPDYAAPEQVRSAPVTTATDIYALGLLLYELLVGRRPFDLRGKTATEIERTICELEGPPNVE